MKTAPTLTPAERKLIVETFANAPMGRRARLTLCAQLIGLDLPTFEMLLDSTPGLRTEMEAAAEKTTDHVFARLRQLARAGDRRAVATLNRFAPAFGRSAST